MYQAGWTTSSPFRSFFSLDRQTLNRDLMIYFLLTFTGYLKKLLNIRPREDIAPPHSAVPVSDTIVPPVDGGVALVEPFDGWQFVSGSHGTQVDQQVVL